ncbi:hypothetical protein [Candidatus Pantoea multigeneris]|uniref:hypothetical protein n=1 Tax=Candidatus Pantoea multigeneris TaxID=2608357 RepID=UPI0014207C1B|nr:hypothetical protein [Pantoea multigeneris]
MSGQAPTSLPTVKNGGDATQQGWILGFAALTPDEIIAGCSKLVTLFSGYGQNAR